MYKTIKRIGIFILFLCFILLLTSCSKKKRSEEEIQEDLQENPSFSQEISLSIEDMEVTKRQTDTRDKTDIVYVTVDAANDEVKCTLSYILTYVLYNKGWILEDVIRDYDGKWDIKPLRGPDLELIQEFINNSNYSSAEYISNELSLENETDTYIFTNVANYKYMTAENTIQIIAYFDETSGIWMCNEESLAVISTKEDWNLNGKWEYSCKFGMIDLQYTIEVTDFTDGVLTCDYNLYSGGNLDFGAQYLGQIITVPYGNKKSFINYKIDIPSDWESWNFEICIAKDNGIIVDEHNLTRVSE